MVIAFCGHSAYIRSLDDEKRILTILADRVGDASCELFFGGYGGFDSFAYDCAKRYKNEHPRVELILITPYMLDERKREYANDQNDRFDLVYYPGLENVPPRYAILRRNCWIVDQADMMIAYVSHAYGGAYAMYRYARQRKKEIYNLAAWQDH